MRSTALRTERELLKNDDVSGSFVSWANLPTTTTSKNAASVLRAIAVRIPADLAATIIKANAVSRDVMVNANATAPTPQALTSDHSSSAIALIGHGTVNANALPIKASQGAPDLNHS